MPTALTANLRQGEMQFIKLYGPTEGNCLLMLNICDFCTAISRNPLQRTQIYNLFFSGRHSYQSGGLAAI